MARAYFAYSEVQSYSQMNFYPMNPRGTIGPYSLSLCSSEARRIADHLNGASCWASQPMGQAHQPQELL